MSKEKIAARLKLIRETLGLKQEDVALHLGTTVQKVSSFETARTRIDIDTLVKLCGLYDMDVNEILNLKSCRDFLSVGQQEKMLLSLYNALNKDGQGKAIEYLEVLNASGHYSNDVLYNFKPSETWRAAETTVPVVKPYDGPYADDVGRAVEIDTLEELDKLKNALDEVENGITKKSTRAK